MTIWLTLLCLTPKTPDSMLNDCQALVASYTEAEARGAIADVCGPDPECITTAAVAKLRLSGSRPWFWELQ